LYFLLLLVENRDYFEPGGCERLVKVLKDELAYLVNFNGAYDVLIIGLELVRVVCKAEHNKGDLKKIM